MDWMVGLLVVVLFVIIIVRERMAARVNAGWEESITMLHEERKKNHGLEAENERLTAHGSRLTPALMDRFGPMDTQGLLAVFAVAEDEPLLQAVNHVLKALEIIANDAAGDAKMEPAASKGYAMQAAAYKEARETLGDWVDYANRAKSNQADGPAPVGAED